MTFEEFLEIFRQADYKKLVEMGEAGLCASMKTVIEKLGSEEAASDFYGNLIGLSIGIDNTLTEKERQFLNDVYGREFDVNYLAYMAVNALNQSTLDKVNAIVDSLDGKTKGAILQFCICLCMVDGEAHEREVQYLYMLLN